MNRRDFVNGLGADGDGGLPGGLERIECVGCGHGVITNDDDVDKCVDCRGSDE